MKYEIMILVYIQLPDNEELGKIVHWKDEDDYLTAHNICAEFNTNRADKNTFAFVRENVK